MMKFASEEIRTKAVKAYLSGKATARQLADILGYSPASICNWVRAYRQENRLTSKPQGHRQKCFSDTEIEELKTLLEKKCDMTLAEIKAHFKKTCCLSAIHRMLVKLGYKYKKNSQGQGARTRRCERKAQKVEEFSGRSSV